MLRQDRKVQCKSEALLGSRKVSGIGESFLWRVGNGLDIPAGSRPRPASVLEGSWLCGKESSSPEPKSGEQWTPSGTGRQENSGGPKAQRCVVGRCLSVCVFVFGSPCLCVCWHCLWSRSLLVHHSLTMGPGESTPLSLMTDHFLDVRARAHNLSLLVKKSKLMIFCSAEWPAFQVGWPPEGTFQPFIIQVAKEKIMALDPWGHPDQVPYGHGLAGSSGRSA